MPPQYSQDDRRSRALLAARIATTVVFLAVVAVLYVVALRGA